MRLFTCLTACFLLIGTYAQAQLPFFQFYKPVNLPQWANVVRILPDSTGYVIFGSTPNTGNPMIIITDSLGRQLRYIWDTITHLSQVNDAYMDGQSNFYIVSELNNFPGIIKYDSSGNKLWQKNYLTTNYSGGFTRVIIRNDTIYATGGVTSGIDTIGTGIYCVIDQDGNLVDSNYYRPPYGSYSACGFRDLIFLNDTSLVLYGECSYPGLLAAKPYIQKINVRGDSLQNFTVLGPADSMQLNAGSVAKLGSDKFIICGGATPNGMAYFYGPFYQVFDFDLLALSNCTFDTTMANYGAGYLATSDSTHCFSIGGYDTIHEAGFCRMLNYQAGEITFVWERVIAADDDVILGSILVNKGRPVICGFTASQLCYYCDFLTLTDEYDCFDLNCATLPLGTGIDEPMPNNIVAGIYPNPFSGNTLNIELSSSLTYPGILEVYDIMGRRVMIRNITGFEQNNIAFEIPTEMVTGLYLVVITLNNGKKISMKAVQSD